MGTLFHNSKHSTPSFLTISPIPPTFLHRSFSTSPSPHSKLTPLIANIDSHFSLLKLSRLKQSASWTLFLNKLVQDWTTFKQCSTCSKLLLFCHSLLVTFLGCAWCCIELATGKQYSQCMYLPSTSSCWLRSHSMSQSVSAWVCSWISRRAKTFQATKPKWSLSK